MFVFYGSKDVFFVIYVFLRGEQRKIDIFHYFFAKKTRNSLFPQCKTSIGNNSCSIEDRAVKVEYSRGFSATTDGIVRLPSLTRDQK